MTASKTYQSGVQTAVPPLTGSELVGIDSGGAVSEVATTAAIAALGSSGTSKGITNTAISTAVGGTLTAAGLVGGLIVRTGPTAAFSDATDTAAHILSALPSVVVGATFLVRIKNATAFPMAITAGNNVTLPSTTVVPPFSIANYYGSVTSTTAVTFTHLDTVPIGVNEGLGTPLITALATNGAGTVTAAMIVGGYVNRTTVAAAFADTTDTAAAIIAASSTTQGRVGGSFLFTYQNSSTGTCTLGGGSSVTVSGITLIPPGCTATYVVTQNTAGTITMVGVSLTLPTAPSGTFVANGASSVTVTNPNISANSVVVYGLKTVGGTPAPPFMFAVTAGTSFVVRSTAGDTSTYSYLIIN